MDMSWTDTAYGSSQLEISEDVCVLMASFSDETTGRLFKEIVNTAIYGEDSQQTSLKEDFEKRLFEAIKMMN